jgi:GntR family transcriptional regulator
LEYASADTLRVMSTNPDRSTWQQIADDLRTRIDAGEYAAGDRLPPRRQLMEHYGAADRTVARAVHQLRDEGYLLAQSTAGWLVRGRRPVVRSTRSRLSRSERAAGRGTFTTDCHEAGLQPSVSTEIRIEPAREAEATALGIATGDEVCVRERVMRGDDEVLQLATSYLPRALTAGTAIERQNTGPGGIYARLEEAGYQLTRYTEQVSIGRASDREARLMGLSAGEPVFRVRRTAWAGDRAVEVNNITITGNRYELLYELPAE